MSRAVVEEAPVRARIPADLDAPDRIAFGLTVRQAAILAATAAPLYVVWQQLAGRVPVPVLAAATVPVAASAAVVALGRRDGVPFDAWLLAALAHHHSPQRLVPTRKTVTPAWAPPAQPAPTTKATGRGQAGRLGVLRLPASAITDDGVLKTASSSVALVAATTVTANLNSPGEQAAQVAAYARWLNALTGPVQIVISARRLDLGARAERIAEQAHDLDSSALASAAIDYAWFLLDLLETHDPLERTITIACTSPTTWAGAEAQRRAVATAEALTAVGVRCRVLDGAEATAVLATAADPYATGNPITPRTPPGAPVTVPDSHWASASFDPDDWDDEGRFGNSDDEAPDASWDDLIHDPRDDTADDDLREPEVGRHADGMRRPAPRHRGPRQPKPAQRIPGHRDSPALTGGPR
ncbi:MAG: PrgI family protein [Kineosporiaceae bacterium]|nr:PrgI family protein [Kineosporiaceae bacterium]